MLPFHITATKEYNEMDGGLTEEKTLTPVRGSFVATKSIGLKLKSNVLRGGVYYRFMLTVRTEDGTEASNVYELKTNDVPTKGLLLIWFAAINRSY